MPTDQIADLTREMQQFQIEKENIRRIVGQIGGEGFRRREKVITISFLVLLTLLFVADFSRHIFGVAVPLPPLFSIEIGILLVSFKIIWMIHKQTRVEHFQFWILNSIEFRIDQMSHHLLNIEQTLEAHTGKPNDLEQLQVPSDAKPEAPKG